ncbi:MAG: hypothetical protein PVG08_17445 [Desulfobacterales bacterium]
MFHQPLNRNDFHVTGAYFVYPQPGCQFLFEAAGNTERQILSCDRDQDIIFINDVIGKRINMG